MGKDALTRSRLFRLSSRIPDPHGHIVVLHGRSTKFLCQLEKITHLRQTGRRVLPNNVANSRRPGPHLELELLRLLLPLKDLCINLLLLCNKIVCRFLGLICRTMSVSLDRETVESYTPSSWP